MIWVDLLTRSEFEAGFGSHTPMFSGQTKCVRYYMNFARALELLKDILLKASTHAYSQWPQVPPSTASTECQRVHKKTITPAIGNSLNSRLASFPFHVY